MEGSTPPNSSAPTAAESKHVVLAKFKADITPKLIEGITGGLEDLACQLDFIKSFEWGTDFGEVKRQQGFTHIFVLTFYGPEGLGAYVAHPAHKAYADKFMAAVENILILDYSPFHIKSG